MILRPLRRQFALRWQAVLLLAIFLLSTMESAPHSLPFVLHRRQDAAIPPNEGISLNATSNALTTLEPPADAFVWEGQHDSMRIQLDPKKLEGPPSLTGDTIASAGPITYHATLDNATALPLWLTFDPTLLVLSGVPPLGTYNKSTTLTVHVQASLGPGFVQATLQLTIRVLKHSLALATSPQRACSSAALYALYADSSQESSWQEYLPDINLDPEQRTVHVELSMELFRIDGCTQPTGMGQSRALDDGSSSIGSTTGNTIGIPSSRSQDPPTLASLTVALSAETMQTLGRDESSLPSWLVFDEEQGTLTGVVPLDVPAKMVLEIHASDSFGSATTVKLQIFSHPVAVPLFVFTHPVPDVWIKSSEAFDIHPIAAAAGLVTIDTDPAWFPIESRFFFQPAHPVDVAPMQQQQQQQQQQQASAASGGIHDHTASASFAGILDNNRGNRSLSLCTYKDLWGSDGGDGQQPPFLSWFNQTSFVTRQPPSENTTMSLQGLIPCEVVVLVRWIARNAIGQWSSTEFRIWASQSGPPVSDVSPHQTYADGTTRKQAAGSLAIKILVALAVAVPLSLALWFLASRYFGLCNKDRGQDNDKVGTQGDLEYGQRSMVSSGMDYDDATWEPRHDRRGPPTGDTAIPRELGYRSSHEDDPSVGHHDSYSDKYVAEHRPPRAHSNASEDESGGHGKRLSFLGWLFRQKQAGMPEPDREDSTASSTGLPREQGSDGVSPFSLKRVSVGSPFESRRFGFVNGSRMSGYDSGSEGASAVGMSDKPKYTHSLHDQRSYRSAASTETGYVASMCNHSSAIDSRQQDTDQCMVDRNSQETDVIENEEDQDERPTASSGFKATSQQADQNTRLSWVPSLFLLDPGLFGTDDSEMDTSEDTDEEHDELKVRNLQTPERALIVSRSDSGALMSTPSSSVSLHRLQESLLQQPLSISTTCLASSSASSFKTDLSTRGPLSERLFSASTTSLSLSASTAPTPESIFAKDRQLSIHASPGSLHRRSIVELLQSNDTPVSPLSAFSASLPSWGHAADEFNRHGKDYLPEQPRRRKDVLVMENEDGSVFEQEQDQDQDLNRVAEHSAVTGIMQETAKWMVVPSTQAIRSVSIRKAGSDSNEDSEWISQLLEEGLSDDEYGDREDDEGSDIVGEGYCRSCLSDEKCKEQRHLSLKSELGIIEQVTSEQDPRTEDDLGHGTTPAAKSDISKVIVAASQRSTHVQSEGSEEAVFAEGMEADLALSSTPCAVTSHSQDRDNSGSGNGSISPKRTDNVVIMRPPDVRARPISYPGRTPERAPDAGVPHRFVKATVGTAFHYAALARGPPTPGVFPSAPHAPSQRHSLSILSPEPSTLSSMSVKGDGKEHAEYRAYLVADPQDNSRAALVESASTASVASEAISPTEADQERRNLPHWIQFNSRMRSLWGRPIPGSAGEWQISLVQSIPRPPSVPLPPLPHSPQPPLTSQAELTNEQRIELVRLLVRDASEGPPLSP